MNITICRPAGRTHLLVLVLFCGVLAAGCGEGPGRHSGAGPHISNNSWTVDAGDLKFRASDSPWRMTFYDSDGEPVFSEHTSTGSGPAGTLGFHVGPPPEGNGQQSQLTPVIPGKPTTPQMYRTGWVHATKMLKSRYQGDTWIATLATTDPGRTLEIRAQPRADGVIAFTVTPSEAANVQAMSAAFGLEPDERLVGFGERSNAVNQRGNVVEDYVGEGPYQDSEYSLITSIVPKWGVRRRRDATYFPVPWLLSSRGYGVLLDNDALSYFRAGAKTPGAWSMEVEASKMRFRVFAGPKPADALERYTQAVGRQPGNYAPWFFGPWVQPDSDARIAELEADDVPTSVSATFTHYLPCGDYRGNEQAQIGRTSELNALGTAVLTYFNPMICEEFQPNFDEAKTDGALIKQRSGMAYTYRYFTHRFFTVSQFDFTAGNAISDYKKLTDRALAHGYEGWMEDFGEYTPLDAIAADGATGTAFHNRYPRGYHCGVFQATMGHSTPLARYVRSGWTGSAACSPIVWGGDPTTSFGFDGLKSAIYEALSMGTSGVGVWGSDIGGYFALNSNALTGGLLDRWIEFGGLSAIMRNQKDGLAIPDKPRPHLWDPAHLPIWRRYAKLHTQLYPYIQAAAETYYATGMPLMRHDLLVYPDDAEATGRDDQYMFGPSLLVAPVYTKGATERKLYLPHGMWVDWWRSVNYVDKTGGFRLTSVKVLQGDATATLPAPVNEIPLLVKAGAVIPMLAPDVQTLAGHGDDPGIVHLSDRDDQLYLLAFPRGRSHGRFFNSGSYKSSVSSNGAWKLTIDATKTRTIHLQATLTTLRRPFAVCAVKLDGTSLPESDWSYDADTQVLKAQFDTQSATLQVSAC